MTLVAVASVKGSPGVSSTALVLASVWPRPVVLVEADPAGADLGFRCRAAAGGTIAPHRGLVKLAAAVREGSTDPGAATVAVTGQAQLLACGVNLVQGVSSSAQARAMAQARTAGSIWLALAQACAIAEVDVIADLGRLDRSSPTMPLTQAATVLLPVAAASLGSVLHLVEGLHDILGGIAHAGSIDARPLLVGPATYADRDVADLDDLLARAGLPVAATQPIPYDPKALTRLEAGERATGRLARTLLLTQARRIAASVSGGVAGYPDSHLDTGLGTGLGTGPDVGSDARPSTRRDAGLGTASEIGRNVGSASTHGFGAGAGPGSRSSVASGAAPAGGSGRGKGRWRR